MDFVGKNIGERYGSGRARIIGIDTLDSEGNMKSVFDFGEKMIFRCYIEVTEEIQALCLNLRLDSKNGVPIAHISSYEHRYFFGVIPAGSKLVVDVSMTNYFGGGKLYSIHTGPTNLVATKDFTHESGFHGKFLSAFSGTVKVIYEFNTFSALRRFG